MGVFKNANKELFKRVSKNKKNAESWIHQYLLPSSRCWDGCDTGSLRAISVFDLETACHINRLCDLIVVQIQLRNLH